ncbi:MAG TPA: molybdenum cofactor guanylyltransferase [Planctomycetota bacterium]|jgi:molybdopterin-guanine dinucleotide biosynthesis protein A|nr:molybdenum cofactor guanylyltransferase [Planctomycetota bacterium]
MPFPVTAGILAGGAGSRLGRNKALYPYRGRPLLARQIEILKPLFERVLVAARDPSPYAPFGVETTADVLPVRSALSGIHAVLSAARTDYVFVAACDLPFLNPRLIEEIVSAREGWDAVVPESDAGLEPLHAVYGRACLRAIEAAVARGEWKATAFLAGVRARIRRVRDAEWAVDGRSPFFNLNTPADAAAIEERSREF